MNRMEDLMLFNSPKSAPPDAQAINGAFSPGNNPFDDLEKGRNDTKFIDEVAPMIKIENVEIINTVDDLVFGAESFPFIENLDCGRESLGILKLDEMTNFGDMDWLCVPEKYVSNSTSSAGSHEGDPLNVAFLKSCSFQSSKATLLSNTSSNAASLFNSSSLECGELSKIYSVTSPLSNKSPMDSRLNEAFWNSTDNSQKFGVNSLLSDFHFGRKLQVDLRSRIRSLPLIAEARCEDTDKPVSVSACRPRKSENLLKKTIARNLLKFEACAWDDSFDDAVFIEGNHLASKFADGSILETSGDELNTPIDTLDCTPEPRWKDVLGDEPPVKCETEDIFKTVDRMVPPQDNDKLNTIKFENISGGSKGSFSSAGSSVNRSDCIHNLSEIFIGDKSLSRQSCSKSKDAKELLENLSEIITSENRSVEQTAEGQNLLYTLANILCSNGPNLTGNKTSSEDSGHSSIEANGLDTSLEALDLRTNSREDSQPNLSDKSEGNRRFSKSFSCPNAVPLLVSNFKEEQKSRSTSVTSLDNKIVKSDSLASNTSNNGKMCNFSGKFSVSSKLVPKKIEHKALSKGPLKAVIPVGKMSKETLRKSTKKISTTPTNSNYTSMFKSKRTSTPIIEKKMQQPVAQSTPEDARKNAPKTKPKSCTATQIYKRKYECPVSPLARPNSVRDVSNTDETDKTNRSGSTPNLSNASSKNSTTSLLKPPMCRRRSASDLKSERNKVELKRSYSIGKDSGVSSSLARVRETIAKAKNNELAIRKANAAVELPVNHSRSLLGERNRLNNSNIKPFNLLEKLKKATGKENAGH